MEKGNDFLRTFQVIIDLIEFVGVIFGLLIVFAWDWWWFLNLDVFVPMNLINDIVYFEWVILQFEFMYNFSLLLYFIRIKCSFILLVFSFGGIIWIKGVCF